jgi:two-component system phosphate regulon response regulator PhoB
LLDLMLPDLSGIELLRAIRENETTRFTPVVFLTAQDSETERVRAFELGADDYILKPCSLRELTLRMRALLRRTWALERPAEPVGQEPTSHEKPRRGARLQVDFEGYRVFVDGAEIAVTALEFRLLRTLATRPGRVQTRSRLLQDVWGMDGGLTTRTVDTHVRRLRAKLGCAAVYVETIRGVGYRFRRDDPS